MTLRNAAQWALSGCLLSAGGALGQAAPTPPQTPAQQPAAPAQQQPPEPAQTALPPQGTVLFQSHGEPPSPGTEPVDPYRKRLTPPGQEPAKDAAAQAANVPEFSDRERASLTVTAYDLDARMSPATGKITVRARLTVRNRGDAPLQKIALQISSSLQWESLAVIGPGAHKLTPAQHLIDTDADHTGRATEAILDLPAPLAPGASLALDTFYSGTLAQSSERLTRIGATAAQGARADWDAVSPAGVSLRGFGNVLWYPVSAPQVFLGEGTKLFDAVDRMKLDEEATSARLHLSVEYTGDAPAAAYFCGRRAAFTAIPDVPEEPVATGSGVATAEFAAEPFGIRSPSLFVADRPEIMEAPLNGELAGGVPMLAVETADERAAPALGASVQGIAPLLQQWLGARPLSALTVLDHAGQPFQDGPLLVAPAAALTTSDAEPALAASLTHAWVQTGRPWMDEGLAQFFALLDVERTRGRDAMVAQLGELLKPLTHPELAVTETDSPAAQEALVDAASELYYRRKAAAVWVMLREIAGEQALQITLTAWRLREPSKTTAREDALAFRDALEKNSGKDLHLFFDDWVLQGRGLPDLRITDTAVRELPLTNTGRSGGWLTTVTVSNTGGALADVPVIVRSGSFSTTARMSVRAAGVDGPGTATARLQTESMPSEIQVNDGTTPETQTTVHRREIHSH